LIADLLDEVELLGAPIHVLLFILQVFLHDVEGGDVFAEVVHALAEQFDAVDGDLQVALDVLARVLEELAFGAVLVFQLATEVEQTADKFVDPAHFLFIVARIFGTKFLKALVGEDLALQFMAESLIRKVGYKNCNALIDF